jgi:7-keto-8-aminopelargonate synthetase-like enzyme
MGLTFFSKNKNAVLKRCKEDYATIMRKRYAPYYHAMDAQLGTQVQLDGKAMIMLSSNDYLGLSFHPKVIEASCAATKQWGTSTNGARPSNGSRRFHIQLEEKLAAFLGTEACHVHSAGYLSCMAAVAPFAQKGDIIFADKNIHSCLIEGAKASQATIERFSHNRPEDFKEIIAHAASDTPKFLIAEGVYSMEGHMGCLRELIAISEKYDCFNIIDDAHGFGVFGKEGRGTVNHLGLTDKVDIICGSMSKSLASTGGYVAGSSDVIEYMRTHSKQTIFSAALSPGQSAAAETALELMQTEPEHLAKLWANTTQYKAILKNLGLDTWESESPAVPIVLGSREKCYLFWKALLEKGVFTVMSIAPAVPAGKDLIRTAISAQHTSKQIEQIGDAMAYALKRI